jgi:predicted ATPase/DNA-binding winged helix-turn-helix (wHTH) protein
MHDGPPDGVFAFGPFQVEPHGRKFRRDGLDVPIGGRAFDLLVALIQKPGEIISNRELLASAWAGLSVEDSNIRVQMARLRRTLGCGEPGTRYITSVAGRGYCFVEPVTRQVSEEAQLGEVDRIDTNPDLHITMDTRRGTETLPAGEGRLVGRADQLVELAETVKQRRFVTIVGSGGVGKTSLAVTVARRIDDFDRVYFIDLDMVDHPDRVPDAIASITGADAGANETVLDRLCDHVSRQRSLIIFDNCEHVIDAIAQIADFMLSRGSNTHFLATSREALRLRGEVIYLLPPLAMPPATGRLTAKRALSWPSVQLFMERAARSGHRGGLRDEHAALVAETCRRLDGNPLAIEIMASRVGNYGLARLAVADNQLALRWKGRRAASPRHQTLEAMIDWSYELLSDAGKRVLHRLSAFAGTFSQDAALIVAGDGDIATDEVMLSLGELVEKSLLWWEPFGETSRYRLLDMTRTYAEGKLAQSGKGASVRRLHALYYMEHLRTVAAQESFALKDRAKPPVVSDLDNIRAALNWAFSKQGDVALAVEMSALMAAVLLRMWRLNECSKWCRQALSILPINFRATKLELDLLESLSVAMVYAGDHLDETASILQRGLELGRNLSDSRRTFHLQSGLHLLSLRSGDFRKSLDLAKRYATEATIRGGPTETAVAEWLLGTTFHMVGDQRLADKAYRAGFDRASRSGRLDLGQFERAHEALARVLHARVLWLHGSHALGARLAEQAVTSARAEAGPLCICLLVAAEIQFLCGEVQKAKRLVRELNHLAQRYRFSGLYAAGEAMLHQLEQEESIGDRNVGPLRAVALRSLMLAGAAAAVIGSLAQTLIRTGAYEEAIATIDTALAQDERSGGTFRLPELLRVKAEILMQLPEPPLDLADTLLTKALLLSREHSSVSWELRIRIAIARLRLIGGHSSRDRALYTLREFLSRFDATTDTADLRCATLLLQRAVPGGVLGGQPMCIIEDVSA